MAVGNLKNAACAAQTKVAYWRTNQRVRQFLCVPPSLVSQPSVGRSLCCDRMLARPGRKWHTTSLRTGGIRRTRHGREVVRGCCRAVLVRRRPPTGSLAARAAVGVRQNVDPLLHLAIRVGDEMVRPTRRDNLEHVGDAHL